MEENLVKAKGDDQHDGKIVCLWKKSMPPIVYARVIDLEAKNENVMTPKDVEGSMGEVGALIGLWWKI